MTAVTDAIEVCCVVVMSMEGREKVKRCLHYQWEEAVCLPPGHNLSLHTSVPVFKIPSGNLARTSEIRKYNVCLISNATIHYVWYLCI